MQSLNTILAAAGLNAPAEMSTADPSVAATINFLEPSMSIPEFLMIGMGVLLGCDCRTIRRVDGSKNGEEPAVAM